MYYPRAFPASAISAGWRIAPANICSHFVVFCFTSRCQQAADRSRIGPTASALSATVRCISSSDFLLHSFSYWKRGWLLLMTHPDRLLNRATLACIGLCSLQVCPQADNRSLNRLNPWHRTASHAWLMDASFPLLLTIRALDQPKQPTEGIENP